MKIYKLLKRSWKRITSTTQETYYISIDDIPLHNWIKISDGDSCYVRLNRLSKQEPTQHDIDAINVLEGQIVKDYGIAELYRQYLSYGVKLVKARNSYIINRKKVQFNSIRHFEAEMKKCTDEMEKSVGIHRVLIRLSKELANGRPFNTKEISLRYFLEMTLDYGRTN